MRRLLILLPLLALAGVLLPAIPAQATHSEPDSCSGYVTTMRHTTGAGNVYESRTNICTAWSNYTTSSMPTDAIVRKQCFLNGQPYGDGTGGCRWESRVALQVDESNTTGWGNIVWNDWCYTCGGIYVQDSGRFYTAVADLEQCSDCGSVLAVRGGSVGGSVRVYFQNGATQLFNENSVYSLGIHVP
jgi:hypothetical protein